MIRLILAGVGALLLATAACAHAVLERASPPVGSEMPISPPAVTMTFSEAIELRFSSVIVQDAKGTRVDRSDLHTIGGDGRRLAVSLPKLSPGIYSVIWHVTSVDTHKTEGRFEFTVTH